jgi:hypothetical protein
VTFDVPETGPYYIKVVNTGPGRASQVIVQIFDVTGKDGPPTDPKDKGKDKDKDKDKAPKLNPKANKPPAVYNVPSFTRGHTDHKLFAFQANKLVTIGIQFNPGFKKVSDIEITVYKGEKGNEVVARQRGSNGIVAVRFTPEATDVYRVHIHNHRDTAIQNQVQVQQQN